MLLENMQKYPSETVRKVRILASAREEHPWRANMGSLVTSHYLL